MRHVFHALAAAMLICADRLTKYLCAANMELYGEVPLIPGVLRLYYTRNSGAAFGLLSGGRWFFVVAMFIAVCVIIYLYVLWRERRGYSFAAACLTLVASGAVGNAIDRILYGEVIDFIDFEFARFAVFNFADICIVCGAVGIAAFTLFSGRVSEARDNKNHYSRP
jgi:signal peptidase II